MCLKNQKGGNNLITKNYNIIPLSIDQGLDHVPVGTAGGYIRLLEAPASANVLIHLNDRNADGIPLKTYHAIEATNIEKIFVTCNALAGEQIKIVQANTSEDFKMVTPASDVKLSSLGSYESLALSQLDKIINPYNHPIVTQGYSNASGALVQFSKTTLSDMIKFNISINCNDGSYNGGDGVVEIRKNGNIVFSVSNSNVAPTDNSKTGEFFCKSGDLVEIYSYNGDNSINKNISYYIEEYKLK